MPIPDQTSHGVGPDTQAPITYTRPSPVENFRWDRDDAYLKWDKSVETIMTGGSYVIQYSDDNGTIWSDPAGGTISHDTMGATGTFQDPGGIEGRVYRIKKLTSNAYGTKSSIWVGYDVEFEPETERCYVMAYVKDVSLEPFTGALIKAKPKVSSSVKYLRYNNKSYVPVVENTATIESNSGLLILPLIPSALITNGGVAVNYNITIQGRRGAIYEFSDKTVPQTSSAWLTAL